ncbi:MAG: M15 family metallopeptidase, partial [Coleofasciculus sp. C3-bin4]|nr:M15 family metallopeptidase [Coleofasciculus sp. C3-bin4]
VEKPALYNQLGTAGMLCVRKVRGGSDFSNHSWGTAIDIKINGRLDVVGDGRTQLGLKELYPYFYNEGFYWGAGYSGSREDSMHFEASRELVERWRVQGQLNP